MIVYSWDEIGNVWSEHDIDCDLFDPDEINKAVGALLVGDGPYDNDDTPDGWVVKSSSWAGPVLTIETRSDRNHLSILVAVCGR